MKLTINADGSQGADTKHKVFWVTGCGGEQGQTSLTLSKVDQNGEGLPDVSFTLTTPTGGGAGQIMIMKHVCPAGMTPTQFDQIATFAEKDFTCPVITLSRR